MRKITLCLAALVLPSFSMAQAAPRNPATSRFNVTITILKQCTITAPATINLGLVDASNLLTTTTTTSATRPFTVTCSPGSAYTVGFASTNDVSTGSPTHQMKDAINGNAGVVQYNLFDVTSGTANAAALSGTSSVISDLSTGASQTKMLKAQVTNFTAEVRPDTYTYTDTVTMTVTY